MWITLQGKDINAWARKWQTCIGIQELVKVDLIWLKIDPKWARKWSLWELLLFRYNIPYSRVTVSFSHFYLNVRASLSLGWVKICVWNSRHSTSSSLLSPQGVPWGPSCCCCSVAQSCLALCDPMDCSTPGLPHHSPEFAQVHVHCISDAIQPSHPLTLFSLCSQSFPASGTFPKRWLFISDDQNTGASASASVLPMSIQGWFPFKLTGLISLLSKGLWGVFSSTTVRRHQFFGILPSLQSRSHNHMWPLGRP